MGKSPDEMKTAILRNLPAKTGRDAGGWTALIQAAGLTDAKAAARWLKQAHGLGGVTAQVLAAHILGGLYNLGPEQRLDRLYQGREGLRPLGDRLTALALGLGPDVSVNVLTTMISFSAALKFAEAKPAGKGRIDLGLALGHAPLSDPHPAMVAVRTGDPSDRITWRIPLKTADEVTPEVAAWLARAYGHVRPGV
ncbi:MAG: DUF5655 domain-containing protein [Azospirillaceae bacterium]|nr:DUF5655 domain-containing protein [Azospirillaceae bacterium]